MQPSRVSSEALEVVPGQPENLFLINYEEGRYKRASSEDSHYLKPYNEREREKKPAPTPQIIYNQRPYQEKPVPRQRTFGVSTTIAFVFVAFFVGGGIGGSVGGALAAKEKSRIKPNATSSVAPATSTVVIDTAGCPMANNSTYNASGPSFLKLGATDIVAAAGQNLDLSNSLQASFDSCLDSCAAAKGCVGASWVIFSPTVPSRNSVCFLKNATGVATSASVSGQTVVSGFLESSIGMKQYKYDTLGAFGYKRKALSEFQGI